MLCQRCSLKEARVHVRKNTAAGTVAKKSFCESCAEELEVSGPGERLLLFPWEERGEGSFSVTGRISAIGDDTITLRVARCSHHPAGSELAIQARYVPEGMRRVGSEFSFNFPAEKVPSILLVRTPPPDIEGGNGLGG